MAVVAWWRRKHARPTELRPGSQWERLGARARRLPGTVSRAPIGQDDGTRGTLTRAARVQPQGLYK
ncbi:hypothetical protein EYF80_019941 [Liparis tanakae]|uniref:Uncharacterized protein n=1 Tax=Liparis tanakae TaxID=230148 RepID=A0A4Z2HY18_9TELE|nr:hypothetical protein EYF80_019941 [Liparis tanakae]